MRSGVSRYKDRWRADILTNGWVKCLGVFATKDEAERAYVDEQVRLHHERTNGTKTA